MGPDKWIKIEDCRDGYIYRIYARNGSFGVWNVDEKQFYLRRIKFGDIYTFPEEHWDNRSPYGTAKPINEVEFFGHYGRGYSREDEDKLLARLKELEDDEYKTVKETFKDVPE